MRPTWEQVVRYAEEGECWICGRTGFKKLAQHLAMRHDLHADKIRETYGLSWRQSLCSIEYTQELRDRYYDLDLQTKMVSSPIGRRPPRSRQQEQTRAAMTEVANRDSVKTALAERNRDPSYNALRAEGLRKSESAAAQRDAARGRAAEVRRVPRACSVCGTAMPSSHRRTCSDKCRSEARARVGRMHAKPHPCPVCGREVATNERRTCSESCAREVQRQAARRVNSARKVASRQGS